MALYKGTIKLDGVESGFLPENSGNIGQVLKKTATGYNWANESGGGGGVYIAGDGIDISINNVISVDNTIARVSDVNTKTFPISGTGSSAAVLAEAQAAYDWYAAGKNAILSYNGDTYILYKNIAGEIFFKSQSVSKTIGLSYSYTQYKALGLRFNNGTVTKVESVESFLSPDVLETTYNYSIPYTPQYDGSPATKKYVDDKITTSASAPVSPTEGMLWYDTTNDVLKVYNGSQWQDAGGGDVFGPASSTDGDVAVFDGNTGKLIKDGSVALSTLSAGAALGATAIQPGDNVSDLVNDAGYLTSAPVTSVNSQTGVVTLDADDISDSTTTNKFVTATDKSTWSGKQDALTTQTAYTSKGTATKVATITTNSLGQVTGITETNIDFPVTSVNGNTGAVTISEFNAVNGGIRIFDMPTINSSMDSIIQWLSDLGDIALREIISGIEYYYFLNNRDANGRSISVKNMTGNTITTKGISYDASGICTGIVDTVKGIVTSVNGQSGDVTISGGDVMVSSQSGNILTSGMKIWAGTEANYGNLGTYDSNTVYLTV